MPLDPEKLAKAKAARFHIGCPEWPYPCPFRSCERLKRCLAVLPMQPDEISQSQRLQISEVKA